MEGRKVGKLATTDVWKQFRQLQRDEVLLPFRGSALCGSDDDVMNLVIVHCGDGHKAPRFMEDLREVTLCAHAISINGGALWMDPEFRDPLFDSREHATIRDFLVYQMTESMILKRTNRCAAALHFDCGKAARHDIRMISQLDIVIRARQFAMMRIPHIVARLRRLGAFGEEQFGIVAEVQIAPLAHIHDGDELHVNFINKEHPRFRHLRIA